MSAPASATAAAAETAPYVVEDCRGVLKLYSDGSVVRSSSPIFPAPSDDVTTTFPVTWDDVTFDATYNLQLRLYKPAAHVCGAAAKLPIVYYIHGGGFCLGSRAVPLLQRFCLRLAADLPAVVISVDYRLAPEHRIPAAMDDVYASLKWLQGEAREGGWVNGDVADFERVYVCGESAGGNIAHNVAVRVGSGSEGLDLVRVRGYVLLAPFFGGSVRSRSELEGPTDTFLNLDAIDRFWRLAIPIGETTDYPLVNPIGPKSPSLEQVNLGPVLVVVGEEDLLIDRIKDYADKLSKWGKKVKYVEFEGQEHGVIGFHSIPHIVTEFVGLIKDFIAENSS